MREISFKFKKNLTEFLNLGKMSVKWNKKNNGKTKKMPDKLEQLGE